MAQAFECIIDILVPLELPELYNRVYVADAALPSDFLGSVLRKKYQVIWVSDRPCSLDPLVQCIESSLCSFVPPQYVFGRVHCLMPSEVQSLDAKKQAQECDPLPCVSRQMIKKLFFLQGFCVGNPKLDAVPPILACKPFDVPTCRKQSQHIHTFQTPHRSSPALQLDTCLQYPTILAFGYFLASSFGLLE